MGSFALILLATFAVALPSQSVGAAAGSIDLNALRQQGMSAYQQGDNVGALVIFRRIIAADPSDLVAYNVAGNCSLRLQDYPSAIDLANSAGSGKCFKD